MQRLILKDDLVKDLFFPLSLSKHVADLKCGMLSIREKWQLLSKNQNLDLEIVTDQLSSQSGGVEIPANIVPSKNLDLKELFKNPQIVHDFSFQANNIWDLIKSNQSELKSDILNSNLIPANLSDFPQIKTTLKFPIYIGNNVEIENCFFNTKDGPVLIDDHSLIMEGTMLRGPVYVGKHAVVKMGTSLYQGSSFGNHSVVGGEVKNSIIHGFSNKSHHGYIGDSYIGEWCNLGAGTTCSNLKNTAGNIQYWDNPSQKMLDAGNKAGMLMGDHVKTAINTVITSGTVIGPFSNIFGTTNVIPKFVPALSWGIENVMQYQKDKLLIDIERWMSMKGQNPDMNLLHTINKLYNTQS